MNGSTTQPWNGENQPTVGWWVARCCEEDLYQLHSEADVQDALSDFFEDRDEGIAWSGGFWPTRELAMIALDIT